MHTFIYLIDKGINKGYYHKFRIANEINKIRFKLVSEINRDTRRYLVNYVYNKRNKGSNPLIFINRTLFNRDLV